MTPMIDMTFQLIIFLMLMVNFAEADQNALVQLPASELAKPPDRPLVKPVTLNILADGQVIISGQRVDLDGLKTLLSREVEAMVASDQNVADANIIIRGHGQAQAGAIQNIIRVCQEARFERFALRAKEDLGDATP